MTRCPPPYRPLRGADPPHFVDREDPNDEIASGIVAASVAAYAAGPCDPRFHRLVVAGSAMGKTALLRAIGREVASRLGWVVTLHACRPKERAIRAVSTELVRAFQQKWPKVGAELESELLSFDGPQPELSSEWPPVHRIENVACSWAGLRNLLQLAGKIAGRASRGLLVMFDDADRLAGGELESLGYLARSLSRDSLSVALLFSGGPRLDERFSRAGHTLDCVWPTSLGELDDGEAREALVVPAVDRGVEFQDDALELLCLSADGLPMELQRLGFAAWSAASGADLVTLAHARSAVDLLVEGAEARAS
jgi:hypothetical protein